MRYFLELRYNGAAYCGWQRQPDMPSVQQTLERALTTLLREKIEVTGAGRTDTGVNASYYVAHFDCEEPVPDPAQVVYKLNFLLPGDIAVGSMTPVGADAHARFAAREREYRYYIEPRKNPFTRDATWQYYVPLDMERMNEAAASLLEYDDFTSFAKLNSNNKTNIVKQSTPRSSAVHAACMMRQILVLLFELSLACFASRSAPTVFCATWSGRWSGRWSMWDAGAIRPTASARSSGAATFRGRAAALRRRDCF